MAIAIVAIVFGTMYMIAERGIKFAERSQMHRENIERLKNGYPPIEIGEFEKRGRRGGGHERIEEKRGDVTEYDDRLQ